jgi:hypothetical protein
VKTARFDLTDTLIIVTARIWGSCSDKQFSLELDAVATQTHVVSGRGKDGGKGTADP